MKSAPLRQAALLWLLCAILPAAKGATMTSEPMRNVQSTLGQLVKLSESILIGTVAKATNHPAEDARMECTVEVVWLGDDLPERLTMDMQDKRLPALYEPQIALVFVPSALIHEDVLKTSSWDYRAQGLANQATDPIPVRFPDRSIIPLTRDNQEEYRSLITRYIHFLREPATNAPESYFWFLHGLLENPDIRIRRDARTDMIHLCRSLDADTLQQILDTDQPMDADIREYADGIADWKRRGCPVNYNFFIPSGSQVRKWLLDLRSGDPSKINLALLELSSTGEWRYQNVSLWRDAVADVLADTHSPRRFLAADLLITVGDLRAVPVLIEGLDSPEAGIRRACWKHLVTVYNAPVRYDPEAPEERRNDMLLKFKSWHQQYREALKAWDAPVHRNDQAE
ncbi:MAG: hypothetical protein GX548_09460 [Lentisphaerae bacterium]|nr:hypothetical protein [Lentisphaerota bacterium]